MPDWEVKQQGTAGIYHYNSGDDQLFLGIDNKFTNDRLSLGVFAGVTNSGDNPGILVDLKETYKYDENGIFNNNLRIRNNISDGSNSTQIRFSLLTVNVPLGKTTTAYLNPHVVGKYNYNTGKWTQGIGAFAGVEQKLGSSSVALEVQRYNIQNFGKHKGNWGVNLIFTKKI